MMLAVDRTVVSTAERQQKIIATFIWCSENVLGVDRTVVSTAERLQKNNCNVLYGIVNIMLAVDRILVSTA